MPFRVWSRFWVYCFMEIEKKCLVYRADRTYNCFTYKTEGKMNRDSLKQILTDQKETYLSNLIVRHDHEFEDNVDALLTERNNNMYVQKKTSMIQAWRLGAGTTREKEMIAKKKIILREDGSYELFSTESTGKAGEIAKAGDYFKVDSNGCPYPNEKKTFEATHEHVDADWYSQKTPVLFAWTIDQPINDVVQYLFDMGLVVLHDDDPVHFFSASLWGTEETAAKDDVIVFYQIQRDEHGKILKTKFNFVERSEFDKTYRIVSQ